MNDEELRRRMTKLFAEYGGTLRPFMEAVVAWAEASDMTCSLPEYFPEDRRQTYFCKDCDEELVCASCEGLIDESDCDCDCDCEECACGTTKVCPDCDGWVRAEVTA
jgi:hypothetical protein